MGDRGAGPDSGSGTCACPGQRHRARARRHAALAEPPVRRSSTVAFRSNRCKPSGRPRWNRGGHRARRPVPDRERVHDQRLPRHRRRVALSLDRPLCESRRSNHNKALRRALLISHTWLRCSLFVKPDQNGGRFCMISTEPFPKFRGRNEIGKPMYCFGLSVAVFPKMNSNLA